MSTATPTQVLESIVTGINSGDLDSLTGLYERMHGLSFGPPDPDLGQARVATRRLRSDLRTFRTLLEPTWDAQLRDELRWLGDERGAAWELPAENVVQTWFGPSRPVLVVRCMSRTTDTIVYTGSPMMIEPHVDGKTVTVTVDNEEASTERWSDADDRVALFAPDGAAFAQRLLHATTLQFSYTPHNFSPVVARFHVAGLASLIERSAKACGWKEKP